jgi:dihydropteroate synthase
MSPAASPSLSVSRLPAVAGKARVYLRPVGLAAGSEAEALLAAGDARRLAGGPFAFTACQVYLREAGRIRSAVASVVEIEAWSERLEPPARGAVAERLMHLTAPRRGFDGAALGRPRIMGVVNVTPDSFSDPGRYLDPGRAVAHGRRLAAEGAQILDVGGESTRPGAEPVHAEVELERVAPVLEGLNGAELGAELSIDTRHSAVMAAALERGVRIINDVTALTGDPDSLATAAGSGAGIVLMHKQGDPEIMNLEPVYEQAALDVFDYLAARVEVCLAAGIARERLIVDPGIGFGKRGAHNLDILRSLTLYHALGCPVLLGVSRKGLTGELERQRPPEERLAGSIAAAVWALDQGVQILRVHDVAETRQALDVWERLVGLA